VPGNAVKRLRRPCLVTAFLLAVNVLLPGCWTYTDRVWQPKYPGATVLRRCPYGGPNPIDIHLTQNVLISVLPAYINRGDKLAFSVLVTPGAAIGLVSDQARIEVAGKWILAPLEYQGPQEEISTAQQNAYELKGRPTYYNFKVAANSFTAETLVVELPIILDPDHDLEMVRVQFDNRTTHCVVGLFGP
jgi:hypothetical protein